MRTAESTQTELQGTTLAAAILTLLKVPVYVVGFFIVTVGTGYLKGPAGLILLVVTVGIAYRACQAIWLLRQPERSYRALSYARFTILVYVLISSPYHLWLAVAGTEDAIGLASRLLGWTESSLGSVGLYLFLAVLHSAQQTDVPYTWRHFFHEISFGSLAKGWSYHWGSAGGPRLFPELSVHVDLAGTPKIRKLEGESGQPINYAEVLHSGCLLGITRCSREDLGAPQEAVARVVASLRGEVEMEVGQQDHRDGRPGYVAVGEIRMQSWRTRFRNHTLSVRAAAYGGRHHGWIFVTVLPQPAEGYQTDLGDRFWHTLTLTP